VNLALNGGRELLDHDPVIGYLRHLQKRIEAATA
jgi:hypothetical protein